MVVRETCYRRIKAVVEDPEMQPFLNMEGLPPIGERAHYLRVGNGYIAYLIDGEVADAHTCLKRGDVTKGFCSQVREQFEYLKDLGVETVQTMHKSTHRRASFMANVLGFTKDQTKADEGYNYYEIDLCH